MAETARQTSEAFGDIEFEYNLKELLDRDPVAALGFDPAKAKFTAPQGYNNAHYLHRDKYTKDGKLLGKKDDVVYGPDFGASKDTIVHEFRHRGNRLLRQAYFKDPKAFTQKYGQDVVDFLVGEFDEAKGKMYLGDRDEEFRTELGDNLEATFNRPRPDTAKLAANLLGEESKRFSQEELEQMGTKFYLQNFDKFKGRMSDATELVTKEDQEKFKGILAKVRQAASDLIKERKGYQEGGLTSSPRPRLRPGPTKTGRMTVRNRPVWQNPLTKEIYSEKTVTIPWGDGYATVPSVDGQGKELSREELYKRIVNAKTQLGKGGPVDFITGEDLPVFDTEEDAIKYAMWRSSTMFDKEASDQGFQLDQYELAPEKEDPSFLYDMGSYGKKIASSLGALGLRKLGFDAYPTENSFAEGGVSMLPAVDNDRTPSRPRDTFNPLAFAKESWESAKQNFRDAGVTEVDLDDPAMYNGYIRAVDYLKDSGLAGLDLIDAAAKAVIGTAGELVTRSDASQRRFQRDIYSMPEAFAGAAGARSVTQLDDALETAAASGVQAVEKAKDIGYSAYQKAPPVVGDIVGQTKSMLSGDTTFRETSDVGPQPLSAFGGAKASYAPNLTDYGGIESTFSLEADNSTLVDLGIDFDTDPTGSLVRLMDEVERDPVKYQRTLNQIVAGGWTRGKDNLLRFEIDDSKSKVYRKNLTRHSRKELKDQIFSGHDYEEDGFMSPYDPAYTDSQEKMYSTLEDVLDHPDLFKHYPELKDMPVVVDTDIESGTLGYFDREVGLVAVAEKVADDADFLRDTLLHEIQHAIQSIEGFTRGTGTFNPDVTRISIAAKNSPTIKKLVEDYDKELSIYENQIDELGDEFVLDEGQELARKLLSFKIESLDSKQEVALLEFLDQPDLQKGQSEHVDKLSEKRRGELKKLQDKRSSFSYGSEDYKKADEEITDFINTPSGFPFIYELHHIQKLRDLAEGGISYTTTKNYTGRNLKMTESVMANEDRYTPAQRLNEVYELVPRDEKNRIKNGFLSDLDYSLKNIIQNDLDSPEKKKLFEEIVGIDPDKIPEKIYANMNEFFSVLGKQVPTKPINPIIGYAANDKFGSLTRASVIYSTKAGEAEARNVQTRKDFSAKERQEVTPEETEDVPRRNQWTDEDLRRIEKGEDIFKDKNIFEKSYARGGMVEKQMQDLFAGSK